ncbi:MAG: hypothetical protein QM473_19680, partial [Acidobacteriota bacterium]|nr:hypothetical protein [Acidobacteriota bacterium]
MPRYKMSKDHRRLVGLQAVSLQRAVDLNNQIADRAAQLEKDLMRDAEGLRKAMAGEESQYRLRRLEAAYLKVMHRLAMVRRAHALAREHGPVDAPQGAGGKVSGQAVADAIRKAASAVLGIPASLLKGRVKGHWRTTESGKIVWVQDYQDKRTRKAPKPTTGRQLSLFDEPEPASAGKPGQASLFGDDEAPARAQEQQPKQDENPAKAAAESVRQRAEGIANAQGFLKERSRNVYQASAKEYAAERDGKPYNAYDNVSMEELRQIQARQRASSQQDPSPAPQNADTFQRQRQAYNDLANETLRLQKLGEQQIPGIRIADAETAGLLYEMLQAGEIKQQEWDKYVRSVSEQGKVTPAKEREAKAFKAKALSSLPPLKAREKHPERETALESANKPEDLESMTDEALRAKRQEYDDALKAHEEQKPDRDAPDEQWAEYTRQWNALHEDRHRVQGVLTDRSHAAFLASKQARTQPSAPTPGQKLTGSDAPPPVPGGPIYEVSLKGMRMHYYVGRHGDGYGIYRRRTLKGNVDGGAEVIETGFDTPPHDILAKLAGNTRRAMREVSKLPKVRPMQEIGEDGLPVRKGLGGFIDRLLQKARVRGHWRTTDSGKMVWVAEYTNRRTKKQTPQAAGQLSMFDDEPDLQGHVTAHMDQRDKLAAKEQEKKNANEDTPPPTAPTEEEAALGRETADNDGTLDAQARAAQDEEKARDEAADGTVARDQEPEPVDADGPQYAIDYHLRDTKGHTYTPESVGEDRASIVLRDENGTEIDRLSPRPTKAAEEDLLKIGSHKYLRKEPGTPADAKAGIFSPGHENWEPPTPEETEAEKAQRIAEEAEAEKARQERLEAEITQRPEPEWGSFDAGEHRWDNGNTVYFVSRSPSSGVYTIGSYARQTGEY